MITYNVVQLKRSFQVWLDALLAIQDKDRRAWSHHYQQILVQTFRAWRNLSKAEAVTKRAYLSQCLKHQTDLQKRCFNIWRAHFQNLHLQQEVFIICCLPLFLFVVCVGLYSHMVQQRTCIILPNCGMLVL